MEKTREQWGYLGADGQGGTATLNSVRPGLDCAGPRREGPPSHHIGRLCAGQAAPCSPSSCKESGQPCGQQERPEQARVVWWACSEDVGWEGCPARREARGRQERKTDAGGGGILLGRARKPRRSWAHLEDIRRHGRFGSRRQNWATFFSAPPLGWGPQGNSASLSWGRVGSAWRLGEDPANTDGAPLSCQVISELPARRHRL